MADIMDSGMVGYSRTAMDPATTATSTIPARPDRTHCAARVQPSLPTTAMYRTIPGIPAFDMAANLATPLGYPVEYPTLQDPCLELFQLGHILQEPWPLTSPVPGPSAHGSGQDPMFYTGEYMAQAGRGIGSGGLQRRRSTLQDMGAEDPRTSKRPRHSPEDAGMAQQQNNEHSRTTELGGNSNRLEAQPVSVSSFVSGPYSPQSLKSGSSSSQIGRSAH